MNINGKRVVVTGGAGFIGSHLVDRLVALENKVFVIDDLSSGQKKNIAEHLESGAVQLIESDIFNEQQLYKDMPEADCLFHLACRNVRLSLKQPTIVHDVNATGTLNVLKAAVNSGIKRFLYCSSSEVNGTADIVPMPEEYHFKPETIYGASKLTGEYYTQVFQRASWLETVIVRPHNNYGPRAHHDGNLGEVIPRFILLALAGEPLTIYGEGSQTRDFTYVTETADFLVRSLESDAAIGKTMNLCRGNEVSILDIAKIVRSLVNENCEINFLPSRPSDVLRLFGDPSYMQEILGSSPQVDIEEGMQRTFEWFKENISITPETLASMDARNWESTEAEPWLQNFEKRS